MVNARTWVLCILLAVAVAIGMDRVGVTDPVTPWVATAVIVLIGIRLTDWPSDQEESRRGELDA